MIARRSFLTCLAGALAAPAVVHIDALMPLRGIIMPSPINAHRWLAFYDAIQDKIMARADFWYHGALPMPQVAIMRLSPQKIAELEMMHEPLLRLTDDSARNYKSDPEARIDFRRPPEGNSHTPGQYGVCVPIASTKPEREFLVAQHRARRFA